MNEDTSAAANRSIEWKTKTANKVSRSFFKDFKFMAILGEGSFGSVFLVKRYYDKTKYALKLCNFKAYKKANDKS